MNLFFLYKVEVSRTSYLFQENWRSVVVLQVLNALDELGDFLQLKYSRYSKSSHPELYEETRFELEDWVFHPWREHYDAMKRGENPETKKYKCISSLLRTIFVSQLIEKRGSFVVAFYCIKFLYSRDWTIDTDLPPQEICPSCGIFDAEWMHPLIKLLVYSFCYGPFLWRGFR